MDNVDKRRTNGLKAKSYIPDPGNTRVDFFPRYIQLEQTNRCNATCIMCNHFYLGNKGCGDLQESIIEKLKPIFPYGEMIMLNGDGEPFVCRSIVRNIDCFAQSGIKIGANTNLCYIPEELWSYFDSAFEFLNISCDGATAETYELVRRGLSFDLFLSNLAKLTETAPKLKKVFDCVVMKQNICDLPEIVELAGEYGVKTVKFHRLGVNPVIGNNNDQAEYYYELLEEKLAEAERLAEAWDISISIPDYMKQVDQHPIPSHSEMVKELEITGRESIYRTSTVSLNNDYYSDRANPDDFVIDVWNAGKTCRWAIERCYIDVHGNVTTCCYNMKKNMGSLLEKSFEEIWNGEEYVALRMLMSGNRLPGFCKQCNWIKDSIF